MLRKRSEYSLPPSLGSTPWLIIPHGRQKQIQSFFNPMDGSLHQRSIPEMHTNICLGCSYGYLMMQGESRECFLLSLDSMEVVPLPHLPVDSEDLCFFMLSSAPNVVGCAVVLVYSGQIIYFRLHERHDKKWKTKYVDTDTAGSFCGGITSFRGKLYLHSRGDSLVVIDTSSSVIEIQRMDVKRTEQPVDVSYYTKALVESDGELFIVILYFQRYHGLFVKAEVCKLNFSELLWERVDSIGSDRAIFVGDNHSAYVVNDARVKGNCIYFRQAWYDGMRWYRFRLDERSFSHKVICPNLGVDWNGSYFVLSA